MGNFAGRFQQGEAAKAYALAGKARLTLVSERTRQRFTFSVKRGTRSADVFTVGVLRGPENEADYGYLGIVAERDLRYRRTEGSRIAADAPSAAAWAWAWSFLARGELPPRCEVWHEGKCGKCGRALTVPESIATGMGPKCASSSQAKRAA